MTGIDITGQRFGRLIAFKIKTNTISDYFVERIKEVMSNED